MVVAKPTAHGRENPRRPRRSYEQEEPFAHTKPFIKEPALSTKQKTRTPPNTQSTSTSAERETPTNCNNDNERVTQQGVSSQALHPLAAMRSGEHSS